MIKNYIKTKISLKVLFSFSIFSFIFTTATFTRSFIGISVLGFRIGELLIGFGLLLSVYFLFYPKPYLFFKFGNSKFKNTHRIIILYLLFRLVLNYENISLYEFKSSSFVWTIAFIYLGILTSFLYKRSNLILLGFYLLPLVIYIFQTGNYPNFIISIFETYSDKFQYMKAADMVLIIIISSIFIKHKQKNLTVSIIYLNFVCFLFLPLIAINSRGALLGLILFWFIENLNETKYFKLNKSIILILIIGNFLIFSFSSLRISNIGADQVNNAEVQTITDLSSVVSDIANEKKTQDVFLSIYFSEGRVYSTDPTTNWRLDIWQDVFEDLNNKDRLIIGYGYGEIIPVMTDPSAPGRLGRDGLNENVHNYFVTILARGGIVNLLFFLTLHYQIIRVLLASELGRSTFSIVVPCLFISSLDITMDGVQFPFIYYFFIGYFSPKKD